MCTPGHLAVGTAKHGSDHIEDARRQPRLVSVVLESRVDLSGPDVLPHPTSHLTQFKREDSSLFSTQLFWDSPFPFWGSVL